MANQENVYLHKHAKSVKVSYWEDVRSVFFLELAVPMRPSKEHLTSAKITLPAH